MPEQNTGAYGQQVNGTDVSPADGKAVIDPYPDSHQGEDQIHKVPVLSSWRPEKAVEDPKGTSQQQADQQAEGADCRG